MLYEQRIIKKLQYNDSFMGGIDTKILAENLFRVAGRILLGAMVCMYMSMSLYIFNNKDDFILGDYALLLVCGCSLYIFYCVGETITNSEKKDQKDKLR